MLHSHGLGQFTHYSLVRRIDRRQSGIALPTVLILLFVITLLGVVTLNSAVLEEKMSSNFRMRQVALNAAESTLKFGEQHAEDIKNNIRGGDLPVRGGGFTNLYETTPGDTFPDLSATHAGDSCTGGYCIPTEYSSVVEVDFLERWEDPGLDVWNDDTKHHLYTDFESTNLDLEGVFETPKYIIEYMGDFSDTLNNSACATTSPADLGQWPFCRDDASHFRVTARALAGFPGQEIVVVLQSTIRVP